MGEVNGDVGDNLNQADLDAMIAMTDYLIREAAKVSPAGAMLLQLAKTELITSKAILDGTVTSLHGHGARLS